MSFQTDTYSPSLPFRAGCTWRHLKRHRKWLQKLRSPAANPMECNEPRRSAIRRGCSNKKKSIPAAVPIAAGIVLFVFAATAHAFETSRTESSSNNQTQQLQQQDSDEHTLQCSQFDHPQQQEHQQENVSLIFLKKSQGGLSHHVAHFPFIKRKFSPPPSLSCTFKVNAAIVVGSIASTRQS